MNSRKAILVLAVTTLSAVSSFARGNGSIGSFQDRESGCSVSQYQAESSQVVAYAANMAKKFSQLYNKAMESAVDSSYGVYAIDYVTFVAGTFNYASELQRFQQEEGVVITNMVKDLKQRCPDQYNIDNINLRLKNRISKMKLSPSTLTVTLQDPEE